MLRHNKDILSLKTLGTVEIDDKPIANKANAKPGARERSVRALKRPGNTNNAMNPVATEIVLLFNVNLNRPQGIQKTVASKQPNDHSPARKTSKD